jgi:dTDP-4-dehydrorhamnose reductase
MTKNILIFGKHGQVATELRNLDWPEDVVLTQVGSADIDLTSSSAEAVHAIIRQVNADLVINASAYTAVDQAENEPDQAFALNRDAPAYMAKACSALDIPFLHISTDYVFDGTKEGPYLETDPTHPKSVYGQSKEAGEQAIRSAHEAHIILRTAWVYSPYGDNFVKTMLRLGTERDELSVVSDQHGCPTAAAGIAAALKGITLQLLAGKATYGTYHYGGSRSMSWHEFATAIFEESWKLGVKGPKSIQAIGSKDYLTPASRPANSVLDMAKIKADFGIIPPPFAEELGTCIRQLVAESKSPTKP